VKDEHSGINDRKSSIILYKIKNKSPKMVEKPQIDIAISIESISYYEGYINEFTDFVKKHTKTVDNVFLYIYTIGIGNKSHTSYLNDIFITLDTGALVLDWIELGNGRVTGFETISYVESQNKLIPKDRAFGSQQSIRIKKIAPYGGVRFAILGGTFKELTPNYSPTLPNSFSFHGIYEYDGYGIRRKYEIHEKVDIKYEQKIVE
jgi:hypothetical protein